MLVSKEMESRLTAGIVRAAGPLDRDWVKAVIVSAFRDDPAARWAYPDAQQYQTHFSKFVQAFGGKAFEHGSAHVVESRSAAALWLPPGVSPDEEELGTILEATVEAPTRGDVFAVFEQMGGYHPNEPHWYLPMIGVDPLSQGQGLGSALMRHALKICDREGMPAYLESSNPRNVPLYERHGFELMGVIQYGSSPQLFPMRRNPASRLSQK
jgi:ribosomal protein S18 acetylase RimI-like enzyme